MRLALVSDREFPFLVAPTMENLGRRQGVAGPWHNLTGGNAKLSRF
jgi:hypothetical protein